MIIYCGDLDEIPAMVCVLPAGLSSVGLSRSTVVRWERAHGPPCGGKYGCFLSLGSVSSPYIVGLSRRNPLTGMAVGGM